MKSKKLYIFLFLLAPILFAQTEKNFELNNINFIGNNSFSESELKDEILSKESPNWFLQFLNKFSSFGDEAVYFDSLLIPSDISRIKSFYLSNGYFKTRVKYHYTLDSSSNSAELTFNIVESDPAYFKSFSLEGLETIPEEFKETVYDYDPVDSTTKYSDAIVNDKKNHTMTFLKDHGYMLANYDTPELLVDTMKNSVEVKIDFTIGNRYQINKIFTERKGEGKDLIDDQLLKDLVGIKPEQFYSNYDIQRGQVRLFRTGLFNQASVNSVISDTVGLRVPLDITVDVGNLNELSPEIIANNEESFSLGAGLSYIRKNFFGDARKLTIGASAAIQNVSEFIKNPTSKSSSIYGYGDLRASIEQPFLFGRTINTKLDGYLTAQKRRDEYNSTLYGIKLNLDFELPQFTYFNSFSTYFNIEKSKYVFLEPYLVKLTSLFFQRNGAPLAIADSIAQVQIDSLGGTATSNSLNALLGLSLGTNKTDNLFFPTRGYTLFLQLEDANSIPYLVSKLFGSEFSHPLFFKTIVSSSFYLPVYNSNENAFGIKLKLGQILTYHGDKTYIPINQRLYAGGSNSVRGWGTRELVPTNQLLTLADVNVEDLEAVLAKGAPTGGFFLMEGSIETRNRLVGKLGSAFFLDYGNTWNGINEFRFDEIAVAVGFGLRYYSDFAPIRIDFGLKVYDPVTKKITLGHDFGKNLWKNLLQFHIGIGEAF